MKIEALQQYNKIPSSKLVGWKEAGFIPFRTMAKPFNPSLDYMQALAGLLAFRDRVQKYLMLPYIEQQLATSDGNQFAFVTDYSNYEIAHQMLLTYFANVMCSDWGRVYSKNIAILVDHDRPIEVRRDIDFTDDNWHETGSRATDLETLWFRETGILGRWLPLYMSSGSIMAIRQINDEAHNGEFLIGKVFVRKE